MVVKTQTILSLKTFIIRHIHGITGHIHNYIDFTSTN